MCLYVCVRALPPQIDSSATCAQPQLPTDGGGIREGDQERQGEVKRKKEESGRDGEDWNEKKRREERERGYKKVVGARGRRVGDLVKGASIHRGISVK